MVLYIRQCEIKDIKLCQVGIKLIALGRYGVTMIFWFQTNPETHCSPAMHNFQYKTKILLYKLVKTSLRNSIFGSVVMQFFLITCVFTHISLKNKPNVNILQPFLTLWPFRLSNTANHLWHLHLFLSLEVKTPESPPSS